MYSFIHAFDALHYRAERNREDAKIKSATHDTEHIIYAIYSDYFVTGDNRLYSRAQGILGWIAPKVKVLKEAEFCSWLKEQIRVSSDTKDC